MDELLHVLNSVVENVDFNTEQKLITDGIINSLSFVIIFTTISDHYKIEIPFEEIVPENFDSLDAMYNLIQRLSK